MATEVIACKKNITSNSSNSSENQNEINTLTLSFVSKVSHEFRSPLTTIQSSIEILESFNDRLSGDEKNAHYQIVYESVSNLSQLLDNVNIYCRSQINPIKPKYQKIDLINYSIKIIEDIKTVYSQSSQIKFHSKLKNFNITTDKRLTCPI